MRGFVSLLLEVPSAFEYAPNGLLTADLNKGLTMAYMKHNNGVTVVNKPNQGSMKYRYAGMNQNKGYNFLTSTGALDYSRTYDRNTLWKSPQLEQYTRSPTCRIIPKSVFHPYSQSTDYVYEYSYVDHLGNLRLSYCDLPVLCTFTTFGYGHS